MATRCRGCGCTTERACPGGCHWVSYNPPICSQCALASETVILDITSGNFLTLDELCAAAPVPGPHKPLFTDRVTCICMACKEPLAA